MSRHPLAVSLLAAAASVAITATPAVADPPGNNGTVFIHDVADDHHPHNVPHVSCVFWADFFGFDINQQVTVSFAGQAPTGKDVALGGGWGPGVISTTHAGGAGNDFDKELRFTADELGVNTLGTPAHQGYHVTMTVATGEPGGKKTKVFWLQPCASGQAAATQSTSSGTSSSGTSSSAATTPQSNSAQGADVPAASTGAGPGAQNDTTASLAAQSATVLGESLTAPSSESAGSVGSSTTTPAARVLGERITRDNVAQVLGARLARATSLPFTGVAGVLFMSVLGALMTAAGVLLAAAARRRRLA